MPAETRVVHCKRSHYDTYIGRPSRWGNPYTYLRGVTTAEFQVNSRQEAIDSYREWIQTQPHLMAALHELKGKVLGCWCYPLPCHGDVLVELVRQYVPD